MAHAVSHPTQEHHHEPTSFWSRYIFSQDHKVIAIQYMITALIVGFVGLFLSWLMRLQLGFPGEFNFINPNNYLQFMTQHGMIMIVYLLTAALLGGFGNYLIPLMIGARDMAFPFLNMLSYWTYLASVLLLLAAFFVPGGPTGAGWTLYPPQSVLPNASPGSEWGIRLMILSLAVFVAAGTMGGLNYVTTVLQMRTRGMTLMRMPLTVWGIFIASVLALFAFPALFVGGVMLLLDNLFGTSFFIPVVNLLGKQLGREGGNPILYQHLFWYFGHPEVYIVILPAMGVISDLLATHARKPIFGYKAMVISMAAIAAIGFVVWAHHMFVSGMNPYFGFWFAIATLIIAIPSAVKTYNWLLTLWKGNLHLNTPMLFAIGFISTFIIGGLTGLFLGNVIVDVPLHDTYFVTGHFHLVMGVSAIFGIFGGLYHWFPKAVGRMYSEALGKLHFWVTFVGSYLIFFPMLGEGFLGVPRRYFSFRGIESFPDIINDLNAFITVVALIVGAAQLIFVFNLVWSVFKGRKAEANPWRATTLEWQTPTTPPPHGNWGEQLPVVYRGAYDYSLPDAPQDYVPQTVPPSEKARVRV
ncbi:MAG: cbb3-type cytochrome c oxidase subunit I [Candidatus Bipolaricaulota bacterium]|nr:cbb3-type cytochrome c oxidase subunit I [Candidatus Bipolaricaulota bacterium]MCS7274510.1 cbb3-type cytochrome c oxidase subunit I [Candidatus Bipolaricaulota bacterium]MDW8111093.1 cbb3-type cytochrome c oxidase subunit I [Candidatus Bipolaricaulota bacterium]MDW8329077.1 cbb3-type cytochrome c oxidase subunit I [Candidatus Bipolaricaulota bacterium]